MKPRGETDNCRNRLIQYCKGQGVDLGCGVVPIKADAISIDLHSPYANMNVDARLMPFFQDNFFDYVYSSHLLEEIQDTESVLKEWLRILKPGGYLILYQADEEYYYPLGDPRCNPNHLHRFSLNKLKNILINTNKVNIIHEGRYDPEICQEWSFEIVAQKKGETLKVTNSTNFKIMVVGGYAEPYIEKCLKSIESQNYTNWKAQVILDPIDNSFQKAVKFQSNKISVLLNGERRYNIANFLNAVTLLKPDDNDVLIMIDGDDWLADSSVLELLNSYYEKQPDLLLTHGSWKPYPDPNKPTNNGSYSEADFEVGIRRAPWRASHLRTCRYKLWKHLKDESLRDTDYYYKVTGDLAIMFPLLEMAGFKRIKFIPEILYIYNQETPFNDEKVIHSEQREKDKKIRSLTPYSYREEF